jgi:hypothetical protein
MSSLIGILAIACFTVKHVETGIKLTINDKDPVRASPKSRLGRCDDQFDSADDDDWLSTGCREFDWENSQLTPHSVLAGIGEDTSCMDGDPEIDHDHTRVTRLAIPNVKHVEDQV